MASAMSGKDDSKKHKLTFNPTLSGADLKKQRLDLRSLSSSNAHPRQILTCMGVPYIPSKDSEMCNDDPSEFDAGVTARVLWCSVFHDVPGMSPPLVNLMAEYLKFPILTRIVHYTAKKPHQMLGKLLEINLTKETVILYSTDFLREIDLKTGIEYPITFIGSATDEPPVFVEKVQNRYLLGTVEHQTPLHPQRLSIYQFENVTNRETGNIDMKQTRHQVAEWSTWPMQYLISFDGQMLWSCYQTAIAYNNICIAEGTETVPIVLHQTHFWGRHDAPSNDQLILNNFIWDRSMRGAPNTRVICSSRHEAFRNYRGISHIYVIELTKHTAPKPIHTLFDEAIDSMTCVPGSGVILYIARGFGYDVCKSFDPRIGQCNTLQFSRSALRSVREPAVDKTWFFDPIIFGDEHRRFYYCEEIYYNHEHTFSICSITLPHFVFSMPVHCSKDRPPSLFS